MMAASPLTNDDVYYASIPVYFAPVDGDVIPFVQGEWSECSKSLETVTSRFSLMPAPDGGAGLVMPAIPALDIKHKPAKREGVRPPYLPEALSRPLIKVPEGAPHTLRGVASGTRSALVKVEGVWYRLKGCGNNDEGFTVRVEKSRVQGTDSFELRRDLRGSAFPHTAARELAMSGRVKAALESVGALGANEPVALALYSSPAQLPLGPTVPTACIVERTLGDRRLGSHVLAGLEILLPRILSVSELDLSLLGAAFPPARPLKDGLPVDTQEFVAEHVVASTYAYKCYDAFKDVYSLDPFYSPLAGLNFPGIPRDSSTMLQLSQAPLATCALGRVERAPCLHSPPPDQFTRDGSRSMTAQWEIIWRDACRELELALTGLPAGSSLLAYTFSRLGADAGSVLRGMHDAGINWGTYQDAMCHVEYGQYHCNAHSNNLVLVSPTTLTDDDEGVSEPSSQRLLAGLDLDMAFDAGNFVDAFPVEKASGKVGMERDAFERLQQWEYLNLLEVLAGSDTTSGVPQVAKEAVKKSTTPAISLVKTALTDTLVLSFRHAYEGSHFPSPAPFHPHFHKAAHALIKCAILIMADFAA